MPGKKKKYNARFPPVSRTDICLLCGYGRLPWIYFAFDIQRDSTPTGVGVTLVVFASTLLVELSCCSILSVL